MRTGHIREFFDLADAADKAWDYSIYWMDGSAPAGKLGRGWFERGRLATDAAAGQGLVAPKAPLFTVPFRFPINAVNGVSARVFCRAFYHRPRASVARIPYGGFLFPLDAAALWNRFYGPQRMVKFQMVLPRATAPLAVEEVWQAVHADGQVPCIATMKLMGEMEPAGMLSFPRAGVSLTIEDMWYQGVRTEKLLRSLEEIVLGAGGALYPAKDSTMTPKVYAASYPDAAAFEVFKDPAFMSDFWQRVGE